MRKKLWMGLIAAGALFSLSACSASTQAALEETRKNGAHFATWHHMGYSLRRATPKETTKQDIAAAQKEKWWGEVILVEPIQ
ncbi:MAG: hypothetical protein HY766_12825 [candidate division NC10 bacterium]|nr:hypothetical protein [candidate division NC10 bacterium]